MEYVDMFNHYGCVVCGVKPSTWHYAPSYRGKDLSESFYCDEHVPRGCSCNEVYPMYLDDKAEGIEYEPDKKDELGNIIPFLDSDGNPSQFLDSKGRKLPCIEFDSLEEVIKGNYED